MQKYFENVLLRARSRAAVLFLMLLLLYVVVPRVHNFSDSLVVLSHAKVHLILIAAGVIIGTRVLASLIYMQLAFKKLKFWEMFIVEWAGTFTNRLLPAGLGALSVNAAHLYKRGHKLPQAFAVVGMNNIIGFVGHILLFEIILFVGKREHFFSGLRVPRLSIEQIVGLIIILTVSALLLLITRIRHYVSKFAKQTINYISKYRRRPHDLSIALLLSMCLTLTYVLTLFLCAQSLNLNIAIGSVFVVFTFGMITTEITPTPGGVIGAEAGLLAAFIAYGVEAGPALACVLLFRLLTFWLPLLPGAFALLYARDRYL